MFEKTFEELLHRKHRSTSTTVEISTRIHLLLAAIWTTWPSPAMGTFHQHNFCMTRVFLVVTSSPVVLLGDNMPGLIQRKNRAGWIPWGCCCSLQVVRVIFFHCHVFVAWTPDVAMVRICELALQESFVGTFLARLSIKSKNFLPAFPQRILTYLLFKKKCLSEAIVGMHDKFALRIFEAKCGTTSLANAKDASGWNSGIASSHFLTGRPGLRNGHDVRFRSQGLNGCCWIVLDV